MTLLCIRPFQSVGGETLLCNSHPGRGGRGLHYCLRVCYKVLGVEILQVSYRMSRSALNPAETQVKTAHTGGLPVDGIQPIHILF